MRASSATIHIDALRENLRRVRELAPGRKVMAIVKADGYGHGLERVARALQGADGFGVACIADGQRLRAAGVSQRIVVLSGLDEPADLSEMRRLTLESVIHHPVQIDWLAADRDSRPLRVWLKADTGMHRLGFAPQQVRDAYARLRELPSVHRDIGLMTHFANSDAFDDPLTTRQIDAFEAATAGLAGERALANSAGVLGWPEAHGDWVRAGGALYGISVVEGRVGADFGFRPAMTLSSRLIAINRLARGDRIGYASTWQCPEDMAVGVVAIGYGDGYPRSAASGTPVLLDGRPAPIVGRVSMDLVTIDLRAHPEARIGDPVILWGRGLPVEDVAAHAGTIGYDLTCGVTRRVRFTEEAG
ncbi:MAG TPA: alanine racemase [Dokdonella sp.]|uniref:alanine racemase n=1 Tax=Dokdonella sp. TaxID=2291710 RepID=UPI002B7BE38F|nr:alanine racemase [Dokdonella sp.]HUD43358.1 alanine racemase [Dokdonella sp.]